MKDYISIIKDKLKNSRAKQEWDKRVANHSRPKDAK
jgi:hypothetical protein